MNRYQSRVKRIIKETRVFISPANQLLVRDYFKALFDDSVKTENWEVQFQEFLRLKDIYTATNSLEVKSKMDAISENHPAVIYKFLYQSANYICEARPKGDWYLKIVSKYYQAKCEEAKSYFKERKIQS
jgi:prenyltransferase beta subunit